MLTFNVMAGVNNGANRVVQDVIVTDNAVFPLAKNVITLDEVPPGHDPTRITPTAISGGNPKSLANAKAYDFLNELLLVNLLDLEHAHSIYILWLLLNLEPILPVGILFL